ncbi:MAG: hypothetical protein V1789_07335 [PVC group bacterium]
MKKITMAVYQAVPVFCLSLLVFLCPAVAAETAPPEAVAAAESGLAQFLTELPDSEMGNFGFLPGDRLSAARVGIPLQLYTITPDVLFNAAADASVDALLSPTGRWFFPVILEGTPRAILTVERMDGKWEAVTLGMTPLAGELEKIRRQWPGGEGYHPKLVAVYQAASYFFTVPEKDNKNFTPLTFDGVGFRGYYQKTGPEYSSTATLSEVIGPLREAVEENIRFYQK